MGFPHGTLDLKVLPLDPAPVAAGFESLIECWNRARGERAMPRWPDFSADDLYPWFGRLALSKLISNGDLRFELFGGAFVDMFDQELTGRRLCASLPPNQSETMRVHFADLSSGGVYGYGHGVIYSNELGMTKFAVIELPLANDHRVVSHFLHAVAGPPAAFRFFSWSIPGFRSVSIAV